MNVISLLNCFYREDVITDLFANLINNNATFAEWFGKTICNITDQAGTLKAHTRLGLGKNIGTPDLVIEQKKNSNTVMIIIIENKLGALEGIEQTNRYASDEGKEKIYTLLKADKRIPIHFIFLTLDPFTPAQNVSFQKKDYRDFISANWNSIIDDPDTKKVMSDYSFLLKNFYEPISHANLSSNIADATKDIDPLQKKLIWIHILQQVKHTFPGNLEITFGETGGFGRNFAVITLSKKEWQRDSFNGKVLSPNSLHVHFEISIDLLKNRKIDFAIHYEPNPYKPKKQYASVKGYEDYEKLRSKRVDEFHKSIRKLNKMNTFKIRTGSNSILQIHMKEHQTFDSLIRDLADTIMILVPMIENMLSTNE